jgi:hypothetical protein
MVSQLIDKENYFLDRTRSWQVDWTGVVINFGASSESNAPGWTRDFIPSAVRL